MAEEAGPVVSVSAEEGELHQVRDIDAEGQGESDADAAVRRMKLQHGGRAEPWHKGQHLKGTTSGLCMLCGMC